MTCELFRSGCVAPQLSDHSSFCGQVLQHAEVIMAAEQPTCWDAGIQPQDIVAFLASVAGGRGQLEEAGMIGAPGRSWDVKEEYRHCSSCTHMSEVTTWLAGKELWVFRSTIYKWRRPSIMLEYCHTWVLNEVISTVICYVFGNLSLAGTPCMPLRSLGQGRRNKRSGNNDQGDQCHRTYCLQGPCVRSPARQRLIFTF